jgi:hypothetical protein
VKTTTLTTSAWASATRGAARNGGSSSTAARRTPVQRIDTERYAVETEDGFVSYGGVASLSATDDAVDLSFTDQAAADLRLPDAHLHIGLELTAAERELIEIGLSGSSPAPISPPGLTRSPCPMRGACHSARRRDAGASHANGSKCSRCSGSSTQMSWR